MANPSAWKCRISGQPLTPIVDFGLQPLGNGFLSPDQFEKEYFFHMQVGFDAESKMLQLLDQPNPEQMFHENYAFFSGTSRFMAQHFEAFVEQVKASGFLKDNPFVIRYFSKVVIKSNITSSASHIIKGLLFFNLRS